MNNKDGASALPGTGLSPSVEPASGLAGFAASIPDASALAFLAEIVVPVLEDLVDYEGDLDAADTPCDADGVCHSRWCQSGGCIVDKLRFARRVVEITGGDSSSWGSVEGAITWHRMLPAQAIEARSGETGTGSIRQDESAVRQDAPNTDAKQPGDEK